MAGTTFVRTKKNRDYSTIDNTFLRDDSLSMQAKGIFAYILSLPENWVIYQSELVNHFSNGRDAVGKAVKELEEHGYIIKTKKQDSKGRFTGIDYTVVEKPENGKPVTENPFTDNPYTENPSLLSTNNNQVLNIPNTDTNSSELESLKKELEEAKATISKLEAGASKKKTKKKSMTEEDVNKYWSNYSSETRECFTNIYRSMYKKAKELDPKFGRSNIQCQQNIIKIFEYAKNNDRDMNEVAKVVSFGLKDSFWAGIITSPEGLVRNYEKLIAKSNTPVYKPYSYTKSAVGSEFDAKHQNSDYSNDDGGF